jgi:hypothetical protein
MRKFRFHIGSFVILIPLFAVCLAALREANEIWDSSVFTLTLTGGAFRHPSSPGFQRPIFLVRPEGPIQRRAGGLFPSRT